MNSPLVDRMREWAEVHKIDPRSGVMRLFANDLDRATAAFQEEDGVRHLLGAWARARKYWREVTGERLI
jgi:hypothetical protein